MIEMTGVKVLFGARVISPLRLQAQALIWAAYLSRQPSQQK
jgi:hypothetical protein